MRSVLHCAILLPSRCKQWGAWVSYVEPAVHRFPIKFSQRRVVHWLRHQYIGNLREGTCLLPNCRASTTISTNLKRQTLSEGWALATALPQFQGDQGFPLFGRSDFIWLVKIGQFWILQFLFFLILGWYPKRMPFLYHTLVPLPNESFVDHPPLAAIKTESHNAP